MNAHCNQTSIIVGQCTKQIWTLFCEIFKSTYVFHRILRRLCREKYFEGLATLFVPPSQMALKVTYSSDNSFFKINLSSFLFFSRHLFLCLSRLFLHCECFKIYFFNPFLHCCLFQGPSPKALRVTYYPNRVNLSCKASPPHYPPSALDTDCQCYNTRNVSLIHIHATFFSENQGVAQWYRVVFFTGPAQKVSAGK